MSDEATDQAEVPVCRNELEILILGKVSMSRRKDFDKMRPRSALMMWWEHNAVRKRVYVVSQWSTL